MPKTRLISPGSIPNHKLLKNLQLQGNYISNDGGDEGIRIDDTGDVTLQDQHVFSNPSVIGEYVINSATNASYFKIQLQTNSTGKTILSTSDASGNTDGDLVLQPDGDIQFYAGATNKVFISNATKTSSSVNDDSFRIMETLDLDSGAGGSDVHHGIRYTQTQTDLTGWDEVYLMYLDGGTNKKFTVDSNGGLGCESIVNRGLFTCSGVSTLDINETGTTNASVANKALHIDMDSDSSIGSGNTLTSTGIDLDITRAGTPHPGSTTVQIGLDLDIVGLGDGTSTNTGIDINVSGADTNYALLTSGGNVGITDAAPIGTLSVGGTIAITAESATPSQPADGKGYIYSKAGGGLYWRSYDLTEIDLSSAVQPADTFYIGTTSIAHNRGSGALTLAGITLTTPDIGTPSAGTLTNCTFPTLNQSTSGTAAIATTVTLTDNEDEDESNPLWFSAGAAGSGNIGAEADGDLYYNPSTGTVTTTNLNATGKVGIGQASPAAILEVEQANDGGTVAFRVDNDDTDEIAMVIDAANIDADVIDINATGLTTSSVIDITANALTTGYIFDINASGLTDGRVFDSVTTSTVTDGGASTLFNINTTNDGVGTYNARGLLIDYNKTAITADTKVVSIDGLKIDIDDTVTNVGNVILTGVSIDVDFANAGDGITRATGLNIDVAGADNNYAIITDGGNVGIGVSAPDSLLEIFGTSAQLKLSYDASNYTAITVADDGHLELATTGTDADLTLDAAHINIEADGHVEFDGCGVGFGRVMEIFSATGQIGSGGTDDTDVDFRDGNKVFLAVTGAMTTLNLIFPAVTGNFQLQLNYSGDYTISNYKVFESDLTEASGNADVLWAGGFNPDNTASGSDIFSFYWDAVVQKAFGVASLAFATP